MRRPRRRPGGEDVVDDDGRTVGVSTGRKNRGVASGGSSNRDASPHSTLGTTMTKKATTTTTTTTTRPTPRSSAAAILRGAPPSPPAAVPAVARRRPASNAGAFRGVGEERREGESDGDGDGDNGRHDDGNGCDRNFDHHNTRDHRKETPDFHRGLLLLASDDDDALRHRRERRKLHLLLLSSVVACIVSICAVLLSAVAHAVDFDRDLDILRESAFAHDAAVSELTGRWEREADDYRNELRDVRGELDESRTDASRYREEAALAVASLGREIRERDDDIRRMAERIDVLRGDVEESTSAKDAAWLRMDELMEENDALSRELREARRSSDTDRSREASLIDEIDDLTRRMERTADERDEATADIDVLLADANAASIRYDLLMRDHGEMSDAYLAPLLAYVGGLQASSDRQHSIILDLTSLVHSLHASWKVDRADAEVRASESFRAADAVALVTGQLAVERAVAHEAERMEYMQRMETRLDMLEGEAVGAVTAVAEAAGRLEYERKVEEEGRWRGYTMEAESILRSLARDDENVEGGGDGSARGSGSGSGSGGGGGVGVGISDTSLLRTVISRRIEEGMASLRSYYHPYNYLTKGGGIIETIASGADMVDGGYTKTHESTLSNEIQSLEGTIGRESHMEAVNW